MSPGLPSPHDRGKGGFFLHILSNGSLCADEAEVDSPVIWVTRLDGTELAVNSDLILTIESTPDTVLALTNGERLIVKQSVPDIMERVVAFRRQIAQGPVIQPAKG